MKRSELKRKAPTQTTRDPERAKPLPVASAAFRMPEPVALERPDPKTTPLRNPFLLAMAKGQSCTLRIPGVCCNDPSTVVACHSNQARHGKAGARKADDCYHVHGCVTCHAYLDHGMAPYEEKCLHFSRAFAWMLAMWQAMDWGTIDCTPQERGAARWALEHAKNP